MELSIATKGPITPELSKSNSDSSLHSFCVDEPTPIDTTVKHLHQAQNFHMHHDFVNVAVELQYICQSLFKFMKVDRMFSYPLITRYSKRPTDFSFEYKDRLTHTSSMRPHDIRERLFGRAGKVLYEEEAGNIDHASAAIMVHAHSLSVRSRGLYVSNTKEERTTENEFIASVTEKLNNNLLLTTDEFFQLSNYAIRGTDKIMDLMFWIFKHSPNKLAQFTETFNDI